MTDRCNERLLCESARTRYRAGRERQVKRDRAKVWLLGLAIATLLGLAGAEDRKDAERTTTAGQAQR